MAVTHLYTVYGLTFQVPFECQPLPVALPGAVPDVIIEKGEVPRNFENPDAVGEYSELKDGKIIHRRGRFVGRFLIENESRVLFRPTRNVEPLRLCHSVMNYILPGILQLRGELVFHANTASIGDNAFVISGASGSGKSTTLAALVESGCKMVADDVTVIRLDENRRVVVAPGLPQMHLEVKAAKGLRHDIEKYKKVGILRPRAVVPMHDKIVDRKLPLKAIFILETKTAGDIELITVSGPEKLASFMRCQFGPVLPHAHNKRFSVFSAMIKNTPLYIIKRPADKWTIAEVVDAIKSCAV